MFASIRLILLITAAIAFHEIGMAMDGHGSAHEHVPPTCSEIADSTDHTHHHAPRHHLLENRDEVPSPAEFAETCRDLRAVAPLPRMAGVQLNQAPTAVLPLPESSFALLFAFTSPVIVEHPPAYPPDVQRALFQVYLI